MNHAGENARDRVVRNGGRIDPQDGYEFMKAHQTEYTIVAMCRAFALAPSGYYAWLRRAPESPRRTTGDHPFPGRV